MKITNLKIEGRINPIGVDEKKPVFSWNLEGREHDIFQRSYRIIVSLDNNCRNSVVWDSGEVFSSEFFDISYDGTELLPDTKYYFKVIAKVGNKILKSRVSTFITGLLGTEIKGEWLSVSAKGINVPENAVYIRKAFDANELSYATLFIYSYGWYEAYLNGKKLDDRLFAPAKSDYKSILFYDVYEITDFLCQGKNALSLIIGDGYNSCANMYMGVYRGEKRFIATINLHLKNGEVLTIPTDSSWKFNPLTPIISNNIYNGEFYDATREIYGWQEPEFNDSDWENLYHCSVSKKLKLISNIGPFIKVIEKVRPTKVFALKDGRYIIDFGQNLSGFVEFKLKGARGDRIRIKTAEEKGFDGYKERALNTETNRQAASVDTYIFKGDDIEIHHPHFTYHGFRYAEVCGIDHIPTGDEIVACIVHTKFSSMVDFKTDNRLINRIHSNALWSVRSNSYSFPTDCPVRDERTPCPMDIYAYLNSAMYMFSPDEFYERYFKSNILSRFPATKVNMTWTGCLVAMPWYFYLYYGKKSIIERYYGRVKTLVEKYLKQYPNFIPESGFGDWCAPNDQGDYLTSFSSCDETEQFAMFFTCKMLSQMAEVIGNISDVKRFENVSEKAKEVYIKRFYNKDMKIFSNGKQAPNLYALEGSFLDSEEEKAVAENLIASICANSNKLDVGIYGIRNFIELLSNNGAIDTALDCFLNPEYPSFTHQISLGATTLWEQWIGKGDMASHNHAMFAGAVSGFYTCLAGVKPLESGFKKIEIKPVLSRHINKLSLRFETVSGLIKLSYKKSEKEFKLVAEIPLNCNADIIMPNGEKYIVGNGKYEFICKIEKSKMR